MKTLLMGFASVALMLTAGAEGTNAVKNSRADMHRRLGGVVIKPNSQKGTALVVNAQVRVAESNFVLAVSRLEKDTRLRFAVKTVAPESIGKDFTALRIQEKTAALVVVIDDPSLPTLSVIPDDRYAVVNVAKLDNDLSRPESKAKFLPLRARRQVLRAFALLAGSGRKGNESPAAVNNLSELDACRDALPVDSFQPLADYLMAHGMTRQIVTTYRSACREGWAPQPTNDTQKTIWDKVHAIPSKPMKIEFDPATQKGKVTQ